MHSPSKKGNPSSPNSPWPCLETLPGLIALPRVWHARLGELFEPVRALILQDNPEPARLLPCPRGCGLAHEIVCGPDDSLWAKCCADPSRPLEIPLTLADISPLEVSWSKLARALCQALGLHARSRTLPPPNTIQFGAWSVAAVPAIVTIQVCPSAFRRVVAELVAQLKEPFLLFAPTSNHLDASCLSYLGGIGAAFFPLDSTVLLDGDGRLRPVRAPGELFALFTPQPQAADQSVFGRVIEIVKRLDVGAAPTPIRVFRLYCCEKLSIPKVATELGVAPATVWRRLRYIQAKTGVDPKKFRGSPPEAVGEDDGGE